MRYHSRSVPTLTDRIVSAQQENLEKQVRVVYDLAEKLYERCANTCDDWICEKNLGLCMEEIKGMAFSFEKNINLLGEEYLTKNYLSVLIKLEMNFGNIKLEVLSSNDQNIFEELMILLQLLIMKFKGRNKKI